MASCIHVNLIFFSYEKCIEFIFQMSIYLMGKKVFTLPSREKGSLQENVFCKWHPKQSYKSKYIFQLIFFFKYILLNLTCWIRLFDVASSNFTSNIKQIIGKLANDSRVSAPIFQSRSLHQNHKQTCQNVCIFFMSIIHTQGCLALWSVLWNSFSRHLSDVIIKYHERVHSVMQLQAIDQVIRLNRNLSKAFLKNFNNNLEELYCTTAFRRCTIFVECLSITATEWDEN